MRALSDALGGIERRGAAARQEEDAVPLTTPAGEELGVVRFRFSCDYAHKQLVREFFEHDFTNPQHAWVIRVSEPDGRVLYENAPTRSNENFESKRVMSAPSFEGVRLELRYRDRSIEQEVRRLALAKTALIGFIDLMLLAGLALVFANVRRELRLSRLKSDFVANVSHELKTPLALIRLFAETLELGRVPNEEKARQYHRIINKESRRLTQLINNILDFSRIEAGRKEYRFVPGDVGAVVRRGGRRLPLPDRAAGLRPGAGRGGRPAGARDRPRGAVAGAAQPAQQRDQVQPGARSRSASTRGARASALLVSVADRGIGDPAGRSRRRSSRSSTAPRTAWCTRPRAAGWGSRWCGTSWRPTAARSRWRARRAEGSTFTLVLPLRGEQARAAGRERAPGYDREAGRRRAAGLTGRLQGESEPELP